jgi:hypothetical protein
MAKFGEGDARWIVADREDGTNVRSLTLLDYSPSTLYDLSYCSNHTRRHLQGVCILDHV